MLFLSIHRLWRPPNQCFCRYSASSNPLLMSIQRLLETSKPLGLSIQRLLEPARILLLPIKRFLGCPKLLPLRESQKLLKTHNFQTTSKPTGQCLLLLPLPASLCLRQLLPNKVPYNVTEAPRLASPASATDKPHWPQRNSRSGNN